MSWDRHDLIRDLYEQLTNEWWSLLDAVLWFLLGVGAYALVQMLLKG